MKWSTIGTTESTIASKTRGSNDPTSLTKKVKEEVYLELCTVALGLTLLSKALHYFFGV